MDAIGVIPAGGRLSVLTRRSLHYPCRVFHQVKVSKQQTNTGVRRPWDGLGRGRGRPALPSLSYPARARGISQCMFSPPLR